MKRLFVIASACVFICGPAFAQVAPTPSLGITSPLGMGPGAPVGPTQIPLGSTEIASPGISPLGMSTTTTTTSGDGEITDEHHRNVLRGILGGGALGAGLGVAALAIPGVGPLAAAGAIAASAVPEAVGIGAVLGAIGGSLNEVLTKHGVSEEDAGYYNDRLKNGAVLVTVADAGLDAQRVREVLYRNGGHNASQARNATI